jgi:GNAT superfamily N-acetyltransferase
MCEEWMPRVTLPLTAEQYEQLPRNPAYQYDYLDDTALLSPRPKHFHGVLDFAKWQAPNPDEISPDIEIRPMVAEDRPVLPTVFADAFERVQPFGSLAKDLRLNAANLTLEKTWRGGDGPWVRQATFTAAHVKNKTLLGGIAITLVPGGDPGGAESYRWDKPRRRLWHKGEPGQPHLTWIFVSPLWRAGGIGSALLSKAVSALQALAYGSLWTTFLLGNDASMLWHWRNGFALAAHPLSRRALRREMSGRM